MRFDRTIAPIGFENIKKLYATASPRRLSRRSSGLVGGVPMNIGIGAFRPKPMFSQKLLA